MRSLLSPLKIVAVSDRQILLPMRSVIHSDRLSLPAPKPARAAPTPPARPAPSAPSGSAAGGGAFWAKFGDSVVASSGLSAPAAGQTLGGSPPDSPRKTSPPIADTLAQVGSGSGLSRCISVGNETRSESISGNFS